jgi:hypothetical protein
MEKSKSQSNKRQPERKVSSIGRVQRNRLHHRVSLAKSVGKLKKGEQDTPIVAIQQVHLLRKQRSFLTKQAFVFEKKAETVKEQVKEIERKIKIKKELATSLVQDLEDESLEEDDISSSHRSKPDNTNTSNIGQKVKKVFRLGY